MSTPKIFLNKKQIKKDHTCTIYILVNLCSQTTKFSTGISCDPKKFDEQIGRIKGESRQAIDKNMIIEKCLSRINDIFIKYRLQNEVITPELLKKEWKNPTRRVNFYAWMDEEIRNRKGDLAASSLKQHRTLLSKMIGFKKRLSFSEINPDFIECFRRYLKKEKNNDINTIHNNMKNLKAYLNIAIRQGIISENPFSRIKIKKSKTDRVFLVESELLIFWKAYCNHQLPDSHNCVLRHFLFMCFTGIRISDLKEITFENIWNGKLVFFPIKTRGVRKIGAKIPLNKYALSLIKDEGRKTGKIFNCISEQRMNVKLKEIAAFLHIPKKITNHSGRHTFATIYLSMTKDVVGLQKILGHSDIAQTMEYVHITEDMLNDNMNIFYNSLFKRKTPPISGLL